jgi:hypothetical protein
VKLFGILLCTVACNIEDFGDWLREVFARQTLHNGVILEQKASVLLVMIKFETLSWALDLDEWLT